MYKFILPENLLNPDLRLYLPFLRQNISAADQTGTHRVYMRIDGKWTVFKLDEIERFHGEGRRLWGIKATKLEMERLGYFINVRHARALYESLFNNSPCINRWRTIPDPVTGRRIILPLSRFE